MFGLKKQNINLEPISGVGLSRLIIIIIIIIISPLKSSKILGVGLNLLNHHCPDEMS